MKDTCFIFCRLPDDALHFIPKSHENIFNELLRKINFHTKIIKTESRAIGFVTCTLSDDALGLDRVS